MNFYKIEEKVKELKNENDFETYLRAYLNIIGDLSDILFENEISNNVIFQFIRRIGLEDSDFLDSCYYSSIIKLIGRNKLIRLNEDLYKLNINQNKVIPDIS